MSQLHDVAKTFHVAVHKLKFIVYICASKIRSNSLIKLTKKDEKHIGDKLNRTNRFGADHGIKKALPRECNSEVWRDLEYIYGVAAVDVYGGQE